MPIPSRLDQHAGYWLRALSNRVSGQFAARLAGYDVSVAQWVVLRTLFGEPDLRLGALAERIRVDVGATSRMVERLRQRGWVARTPDPVDRRSVTVALTEAGRALVPQLAAEADDSDAACFGVLNPEERAGLLALIREMLARNGWQHDVPLD